MLLHQLILIRRHLGDVNHGPSPVTGSVKSMYLFLGDGFHVPTHYEESLSSSLSVEISFSLIFSSSSSSGSSHQFLLGGGGGCTWRCSSPQFGAIFCGTGSRNRTPCATLSFLLRSTLDSCVGCLGILLATSPSSFLRRSVGASGL